MSKPLLQRWIWVYVVLKQGRTVCYFCICHKTQFPWETVPCNVLPSVRFPGKTAVWSHSVCVQRSQKTMLVWRLTFWLSNVILFQCLVLIACSNRWCLHPPDTQKGTHQYISCSVISIFLCVIPFVMFSFPRYPLRGWPVSRLTWAGTELPPAERWASPCFVFWKACQVRTLAHWCRQWKSWADSVPHDSEKQLGRFHQAFSQSKFSHVLFLVRRRVWPILSLWNTCHSPLLWKICKQGCTWPRWDDVSSVSWTGGVRQWIAATGWGADPYCRTLQVSVSRWPRRMWSLLQCLCRVCEDVWWSPLSAFYYGGSSDSWSEIQLGADSLGSLKASR